MVFYKDMRNQNWLFPPSVLDLIPENHICFLVDEVIESMDFSEIEKKYQGPGHPAYHPKIMLKLLIMGAIDGIRSSRRIARMARENVVYMFLAGNLKPDFRTISDFRKNNADLISQVFKRVVDHARDAGLIKLGHVSIDGTKIRANASNEKWLTKDEVKLLERILEEIKIGIEVDEEEDREYGESDGYEMDEKAMEKLRELRRKRKAKLEKMLKEDKLKDKIEKMKESKASKVSITDPECWFMRLKGFELCYNAQISIDSETGIIVARDVTNENVDYHQLIPQLEQVKANTGEYPEEISADNGYYSGENLVYLAERGINTYIPDENTAIAEKGGKAKDYQKEKLKYYAEGDYFECGHGKITFRYKTYDKSKGREVWIYKGENCKACPIRKECVKNRSGVKVVKCFLPEKIRVEMLNKMRSEDGKRKYKLRKKLEKVFGHIKHNLGLRQFLTRGLERVKIEFDLACIAYNLRRIWSIVGG